MLSERLKVVADCVLKCDIMADIGTDHAYIPIYLVKNNIVEKAIAADISEGSCKKARLNVNSNHLYEKVDVRCGNGLEVIEKNEVIDCIVIAGMGGLMAINVLESNTYAVSKAKRLILQPQKDIGKVREYIDSIGFKIIDEKMLKENGKYYNVIVAEKGKESYSKIEFLFGKRLIEEKSPILKEYILFEQNKLVKILKNMEKNNKCDDSSYKRLFELEKDYEEVLKWI